MSLRLPVCGATSPNGTLYPPFAINLDLVKHALVDREGWTPTVAAMGIQQYRRFLQLYASIGVAQPSLLVDTVWHWHLLHTRQYSADGQHMFGHYLHHNPLSFDKSHEAGRQRLETSYANVLSAYEEVFCESPPEPWWPALHKVVMQSSGCSQGQGNCRGE